MSSARSTPAEDAARRSRIDRLTGGDGAGDANATDAVSAIRGTAGTDTPVQGGARRRWQRGAMFVGGALAVLLAVGWWVAPTLRGYFAAPTSISEARLRFATVERGRFVRDVAAEGIVVAAVSPTLFAPEDGTVTFQVKEGDVVQAGAPLAVIDSPELQSQLQQERATLSSLATGLARRELENRARDLENQQEIGRAHV